MDNWLATIAGEINGKNGALAVIAALIGSAFSQILTNRQKLKEMQSSIEQSHLQLSLNEAHSIRKELRETVAKLEASLGVWQQKYYEDINKLKEENFKLSADMHALKIQLMHIREMPWMPEDQKKAFSL